MADRRGRILAAAKKRFAEFGFNATTVRQIADDVQIMSGSLYHHFATKEEMLGEIVRDPVLRLRDCSIAIAASKVDAELRLAAMILAYLAELTEYSSEHAILFHERKLFRRSPDFSYVALAKRETYEAWNSILADGVRYRLFRADTDIFLTISTTVRMLTTGADWYTHEDGSPIDALASYSLRQMGDFYLGFVLHSLRTAERSDEPVWREGADKIADRARNSRPSAC